MTRGTPIPETMTLHVPFRIVTRGERKEMQLPSGESAPRARFDNTMIKAIARAFRWQRLLDSGEFATIADLAAHERIAAPYLTRLLRLTQLSPEIVEAIVEGRQPPDLTLESLRAQFPMDWNSQRALLRL